jgi:hypothetical protein
MGKIITKMVVMRNKPPQNGIMWSKNAIKHKIVAQKAKIIQNSFDFSCIDVKKSKNSDKLNGISIWRQP